MFNNEEVELTDAERAAFAGLPRERAPGDLLEERIVRQLRSDGMFTIAGSEQPRRSRAAFFALRIAAAVTLFAAGALTERFIASRGSENKAAPAQTRAAQQKTIPAQRQEPSRLAQLELWI